MSGSTQVGGPASDNEARLASERIDRKLSEAERAALLAGHARLIAARKIREAEAKRIFKSRVR